MPGTSAGNSGTPGLSPLSGALINSTDGAGWDGVAAADRWLLPNWRLAGDAGGGGGAVINHGIAR
jgi:hypothetical protein